MQVNLDPHSNSSADRPPWAGSWLQDSSRSSMILSFHLEPPIETICKYYLYILKKSISALEIRPAAGAVSWVSITASRSRNSADKNCAMQKKMVASRSSNRKPYVNPEIKPETRIWASLCPSEVRATRRVSWGLMCMYTIYNRRYARYGNCGAECEESDRLACH